MFPLGFGDSYTDFLVNEVSLDGEVIHLTELRPSKEKKVVELRESVPNKASSANLVDVPIKTVERVEGPDKLPDIEGQTTATTTDPPVSGIIFKYIPF
jgi:hypothetical protein